MAKGLLDDRKIDVACSQCDHQTKKTVGWLRDHDEFVCAGCGTTFETKTLRKALNKAGDSLVKLGRKIGKPRR